MSVEAVRTPEERFTELPDFLYQPHYRDFDGLRLAYLDEGDGEPVIFFHGEPTWSFLWRTVFPPIRDAGHRCIAPDYAGFGRSDKPVELSWYTYLFHTLSVTKKTRVAGTGRRPVTGDRVDNSKPGHGRWTTATTVGALLVAFATVAATIGGLYFNALQVRQAQEAQSAERFSRSVEQLGSPSIAVRIGAIFSLDQLWQESEVYQDQVLNVMTSFIRIQAANEAPAPRNRKGNRPLPEDIAGAMAIFQNMSIGIVARDVDFSGFDLSRWFLEVALLEGSDLTSANLTGANLTGADLTGADLTSADLTSADLTRADLTSADLTGANLTGANLTEANMSGANLTEVACDSSTIWPSQFPRPQCPR